MTSIRPTVGCESVSERRLVLTSRHVAEMEMRAPADKCNLVFRKLVLVGEPGGPTLHESGWPLWFWDYWEKQALEAFDYEARGLDIRRLQATG